ncbi:MAG: hypothetical protein R3A12_11595 [Ignavibacteria bacterium]
MINITKYGSEKGVHSVSLLITENRIANCDEIIWIDIYDESKENSVRILKDIFSSSSCN